MEGHEIDSKGQSAGGLEINETWKLLPQRSTNRITASDHDIQDLVFQNDLIYT